jgi:predicted nucleotide-binding protein
MKPEELNDFLKKRNTPCVQKVIQHGVQFRCETGEVFTIYKTGKVVIGGKRTPLCEELENLAAGAQPIAKSEPAPNARGEIFIVYGHDTDARNQLELMLRRMEMNPIILANLPAAGDTIIEKLESYIGQHGKAGYACVLVTPDDEGFKAGEDDKKKYRARQNVVLELGMVLARLGRNRVAILQKQTVERPSDIDGLIYIPFKEKVEEISVQLIKELQAAGFTPKL